MADISLEKTLPNNLEAERAVLGAVLLDDKAFLQVFEKLQSEDFYLDGHRKIFGSMLGLLGASQPIDLVTLKEELQKAAALEAAGGAAYLAGLTDGLPRALNIEYYAAIVKEKSTLRRIIRASNEAMARSYKDEDPADEVLESLEKSIFDIAGQQFKGGFADIKEVARTVYDEIEERANNKTPVSGLETGLKDLDKMTGGLHASDLIILAAKTGGGKTSLCLNIAIHVALKLHKSVAIFSLEMSKEQLVKRFYSSEARIEQRCFNEGYLRRDDWMRLQQVAGDVSASRIHIDDTANISIANLRTQTRRLALEKGLDLLIVDYLQLMSGGSQRYENRTLEIAQISRGLKGVAKELNIPVIALAQLSRAADQRNRKEQTPKLSDLRESGSIEQDADIVMFIDCEKQEIDGREMPTGQAKLILAKHRNGATGTIDLAWSPQFTKFGSLARD